MLRSLNSHVVKGAIAAQIAITALSLTGLDQVHWTASASFVISLTAGLLSVYYACIIQVELGSMHNEEEAEAWLTTETLVRNREDPKVVTPSYSSVLLLAAPVQLLNWSLASLLVGIGIYYGLIAAQGLRISGGDGANLAILLVYVVFTAGGLMSFVFPATLRLLEKTEAAKDKFYVRYQDMQARSQDPHQVEKQDARRNAEHAAELRAAAAKRRRADESEEKEDTKAATGGERIFGNDREQSAAIDDGGNSIVAGGQSGKSVRGGSRAGSEHVRDDGMPISQLSGASEGLQGKAWSEGPVGSNALWEIGGQGFVEALKELIAAQEATLSAQQTLLRIYEAIR